MGWSCFSFSPFCMSISAHRGEAPFLCLENWNDSVRFSIEGKEIGGLEIEGYIEDKKLAYDLYFNQAYIDEQTMMNIAKSLKLNH